MSNPYDQCASCAMVGDIVACHKTGCEFRNSWYIKFLREQIEDAEKRLRTRLSSQDPNIDFMGLNHDSIQVVLDSIRGKLEQVKESLKICQEEKITSDMTTAYMNNKKKYESMISDIEILLLFAK